MAIADPQDVLTYWIGAARNDASVLPERNRFWFGKSPDTDRELVARFTDTLTALADGLANEWAETGSCERLAAIIVLDQFSRNIYRNMPEAFAHDPLALSLCKAGIACHADDALSESGRQFFYLPLEHSEDAADQELSIRMYEKLSRNARPQFRQATESALDYARQHKAVIDRFGRYPHRNAILGRPSTPEERGWLAEPGSGF